jgi:hypothetical protein
LDLIDGYKNGNLLLSITITFLAIATGSISVAVVVAVALQLALCSDNARSVPATLIHGNITAAVRTKPFGGEPIGTYAAVLIGQKVEIKIYLHKLPESGDILEARLLDTNTNSTLSLGRIGANSTIPISQGTMSLFAYNQIIITKQGTNNTSNSKHSKSIGGAALQAPFGNNFIF